jgi:hypothetical protein
MPFLGRPPGLALSIADLPSNVRMTGTRGSLGHPPEREAPLLMASLSVHGERHAIGTSVCLVDGQHQGAVATHWDVTAPDVEGECGIVLLFGL